MSIKRLLSKDIDRVASEVIDNCAMTFTSEYVAEEVRRIIGPITDQQLIENAPLLFDQEVLRSVSRQIGSRKKFRAIDKNGVRDFLAWDTQVIALGRNKRGVSEYIQRRDATLIHIHIHQATIRENEERMRKARERDEKDEAPILAYMDKYNVTWGVACTRLGCYGRDDAA